MYFLIFFFRISKKSRPSSRY